MDVSTATPSAINNAVELVFIAALAAPYILLVYFLIVPIYWAFNGSRLRYLKGASGGNDDKVLASLETIVSGWSGKVDNAAPPVNDPAFPVNFSGLMSGGIAGCDGRVPLNRLEVERSWDDLRLLNGESVNAPGTLDQYRKVRRVIKTYRNRRFAGSWLVMAFGMLIYSFLAWILISKQLKMSSLSEPLEVLYLAVGLVATLGVPVAYWLSSSIPNYSGGHYPHRSKKPVEAVIFGWCLALIFLGKKTEATTVTETNSNGFRREYDSFRINPWWIAGVIISLFTVSFLGLLTGIWSVKNFTINYILHRE